MNTIKQNSRACASAALVALILGVVLALFPQSAKAVNTASNATRISAYQSYLNNLYSKCNTTYNGCPAIRTSGNGVQYYRIYYAFSIGYFADENNVLRPHLVVLSTTIDSYGISGGAYVELFKYVDTTNYVAGSEDDPYPHIQRVTVCRPTSEVRKVQFYDSKSFPNEAGLGEVELFFSNSQASSERNWLFIHSSMMRYANKPSDLNGKYLTIEYRNGKYYAWTSGSFTAEQYGSSPLNATTDANLISPSGTSRQTKTFYFNSANIQGLSSGKAALATGWYKVFGTWYYYSKGEMLTNSWITYNGKYYYLGSSGNTVANVWVKYNGKYYYMNASGNPVINDWVVYGGKYYYMNAQGNPVINDWVEYNGIWYHFNASGVCDGAWKAA